MNKHMKKIISVLIAAAMTMSTFTMAFAADDDATEATTTATETTETTETEATEEEATEETAEEEEEATEETEEAEEATEETEEETTTTTTATASSFDDDDYYQEALSLLMNLGVIVGNDNGDVLPDDNITRTEMATIINRILKISSTTYTGIFTDVADDFWGAGIIQSAYDAGIIAGYGDGTFGPNDEVTYEQVAKMLVCAINYQDSAENSGGYPAGYLSVASQQDITKNASGTTGAAAPRGLVIKMVYNTLVNADYAKPTAVIGNYVTYDADAGYTLASEMFDVERQKGIVLATSKKSLVDVDMLEGQIRVTFDGYADDEYSQLETTVENPEDYVGYYSYIYYQTDSSDEATVIAISPISNKNSVIEIDAGNLADDDDAISATNKTIKYTPDSTSSKTKTLNLSNNVSITYNGQIAYSNNTVSDKAQERLDALNEELTEDTETGEAEEAATIDDFLKPSIGTITLVDKDTDGKYDYVFIDDCEIMLVSTASEKKITGYINGSKDTIDVDTTTEDKTITVIREGDEVKPRNLKKDDVATVKRNLDETTIDIEVVNEQITGTITRTSDQDNKKYVTVDGTVYEVDKNVYIDPSTGDVATNWARLSVEATFTLDTYGRIGNIEYSSTTGGLTGKEKYGWVVNAYVDTDSGDEDLVVKLYDVESGVFVTYPLASKVNYWAPGASSNLSVDGSTITRSDLLPEQFQTASNGTYIKFCKYETNSSGQISKLFCAISSETDVDSSATGDPIVFEYTLANRRGVGSIMDNKYQIVDGITEVYVPEDSSSTSSYATDISSFSTGSAIATSYLPRESGGQDTLIIDFDSTTKEPGILVRFNTDQNASDTSIITDNNWSATDHATFIVDSISKGSDSDGETVYYVDGVSAGTDVTYIVNDTTAIYEIQGSSVFSTRLYNVGTANSALFDQTNSAVTSPDLTSSSCDVLNEGDLCLLQTKGTTAQIIVKICDASELASDGEFIWSSGTVHSYNTESREAWFYGVVEAVEISDNILVTAGGNTFSISSSLPMVTVEISNSGKVELSTDTITADELTENSSYAIGDGSTSDAFDVLVVKTHRGAISACYVYRFDDGITISE